MPAPENRFKQALAAGQMQYGCWAGFADTYPTEVLATAGFGPHRLRVMARIPRPAARP